MSNSLISIIIVNYNGKEYLLNCLEGVFASTYPDFEVIVVDNGSEDGSVAAAEKMYGPRPNFKVVALEKNFGPSYARNRGVEVSQGRYIAFLDNDTRPEPSWLEPLVGAMEKDSQIGACQCKILLMDEPEKIDYVGDYISNLGFLVQRAPDGTVDEGQFDQPEEILSAKSAAMAIRREAFDQAGGFDEDYFIYVEETDLGWRVWLSGYKIVFVPQSVVYHKFGTSAIILPDKQGFLLKFHGTKNYIQTLFKNLGLVNLLKILPVHVGFWLGMAVLFILKRRFKSGWWILRGIFWNLSHSPYLLKKRRQVQRSRIVSDAEIFPKIMRRKPFSYFYQKFLSTRTLGHAKGFSAS